MTSTFEFGLDDLVDLLIRLKLRALVDSVSRAESQSGVKSKGKVSE